MPEQQNIEYKSSWHEEYLDWICGFANAQGGKIYIGKDNSDLLFQDEIHGNLFEQIEKRKITSSEYAKKFKISDRTARRDLSELAEMKLLKNEGDNKLSHYVFP